MDPQMAWEQLQEAYGNADWETARELAQGLLDWLARDGFPPMVQDGNFADLASRRAHIIEFCRDAIRRAATS